MRLVRFLLPSGTPQLGVLDQADQIAPLDVAPGDSQGVELILAATPGEQAALASAALASDVRHSLSDVKVLAPVPQPSKVFGIGLNYADHIAEGNMDIPEVPAVFAKFPNAVSGPGDPIHRPQVSNQLDYEGELCIVIGREARAVSRERATEVIGGYTIINDVTVRDWQLRTQHWSLGKSFDTHGPTGPWVATADEIDPEAGLALRTWVNEDLRQDSNTRHLVFDCRQLVSHLSQACTLYPGDLIATGTPAGVGAVKVPPAYLVAGDEVRVEIEGLGALVNPVIEQPAGNRAP
jgi:2-keto-4-pentenoate hydratase/2-oxohepta-3-ene-1,7-dioic acid hydratase in catechol pathway